MMKKLVFYSFVSLLFGINILKAQTIYAPFTQQKTWDGPFDIKMVAAPNLQAVYLDATQATTGKLKADSIIRNSTITMTNTLIDINNRFKGGSPFVQFDIPIQALACKDPSIPCMSGLILNTANSSCPTRYNSPTYVSKYVSMSYSDYDGDNSTFSSSMSQLDVSKCVEIESAYLYWTGNFKGSNPAITLVNSAITSYTGDGTTVFNTSATSGYKTVKFKRPGGVYQNVTATKTYTSPETYVCVSDVTALVQGTGGGQFWVGNIQSYPNEGNGGSTSGWTLVVVFRSPLSSPRLISLYDGFVNIPKGSTQPFTLTGLTAPATTNFQSYVGFASLDGENSAAELGTSNAPEGLKFQTNAGGVLKTINPYCDGDQPKYKLWSKKAYPAKCDGSDNLDGNGCKIPMFDATWCTTCDGVSSSHISTYDAVKGTNGNELTRLPANTNTLGYDSHFFKLPDGAVAANATTATLTVEAGNQGSTMPFMAFLAIEKLQPKLVLTKKADKDQTKTNEKRTYTLKIVNAGNQDSFGGDVLTDTLDPVTNYSAGTITSFKYVKGAKSTGGIAAPNITTAGNSQILKFTVPVIKAKDSLEIIFDIDVLPVTNSVAGPLYTACKRTIYNVGWIEYIKNSLNEKLKSKSNSGECNDGSEVKIQVVDASLDPTPKVLATVDASGFRTESIRKHFKRQILLQKALINNALVANDTSNANPQAFNVLFYDSNGNLISGDDVFPITGGSAKYTAYRNFGGATCTEKIEITFNFCTPPAISAPSTGAACSGVEYKSGAITAAGGTGTITFDWTRAAVSGVSNVASSGSNVALADGITETLSLANALIPSTKVIYTLTPKIGTCVGSSFKLEVTVNPTPVITGTLDVCEGLTTQLSSTSSPNGTSPWTSSSLVNATVNAGLVTGVKSGSSDITFKDLKGCTSKITVNILSNPVITGVVTMCLGKGTTLTSTGSGLTWTSADANVATVNSSGKVTGVKEGTIDIVSKDNKGCSTKQPVTVNAVPVTPTFSGFTTICLGKDLSLKASSTTAGVKYFWTKPSSSLADTTGHSDVMSKTKFASTETGTYKVTATLNGCVSAEASTTVSLNDTVKITSPPKAVNLLCQGDPLILTVVASGTSITNYQWKKIQNGTTTSVGTNSSTFSIPTVEAAKDSGSYFVEVTGVCGMKQSGFAKVFINTPPKITNEIDSTGSCVGESALMTVVAIGPGTLKYKWTGPKGVMVDGGTSLVSGATTDKLQISKMDNSDQGTYSVEITNGCTPPASSIAKITVISSSTPSVELKIDSAALCGGNSIVLEAINTKGGGLNPKYTFKRGDGTVIGTADQSATKTSPLVLTNSMAADVVENFTVTLNSNSACLGSGVSNLVTSTKVPVKIYAKPATPNAGSPKTICDASYKLQADPISLGTGTWSTTEVGVTFDLPNSNVATVSNLPAGAVGTPKVTNFIWTVKNGTCPPVPSIPVAITRSGIITPSNLVSDNGKYIVCEGGFLNFSGNASVSGNGESSAWSWDPTNDITLDTSVAKNKAKITFAKAGIYNITYKIKSATCDPSIVTKQVTVKAPPMASITLPIVLSNTTSPGTHTFNTSPLPIKAVQPLPVDDYKGEWAVSKIVGVLDPQLTSAVGSLTNSVDKMDFNESAKLTWTVSDVSGACTTPAVVTVIIERKNITEALSKDDTLCFGSGGSMSYTLTPKVGHFPNTVAKEEGEWLAVGSSPVPSLNGETANVTFTAPGDYKYVYRIFNPTILDGLSKPIESKNEYTIKVDAMPTTSVPGAGGNVCTLPYPLSANAVDLSKGETGLWSGGGVTFSDETSNVSKVDGMNEGIPYTLTWSIYSKYKTCLPSKNTVQYKKLKDVVKAKISTTLKDYCENTSFSLTANAADVLNSEKGVWFLNKLPIAGTQDLITLPLSNLTQGTYTYTWKISSTDCPDGTADSITITVDKKPVLGTISGLAVCEDNKVEFSATGFTSVKSPKYTWSVVPSPSTTSSVTGTPDTTSKATYTVKSTATSGTTDQVTVNVDVKNVCGTTSAAPFVYTFDLRPRGIPIAFTSPILKICASDAGPVKYTVTPSVLPALTDYNWYWNGTKMASTGNSFNLNSLDFISKVGQVNLEVRAYNKCGEAKTSDNASAEVKVEVSQSKQLEVTIKADKSDSVCVADALLNMNKYIATAKTNGNPLSGSEMYTFTVKDVLGNSTATSINTTGIYDATMLNDGDKVSVELSDPTGCFDTPRIAIADTVVNGFNYPNSTIINLKDTVCEGRESVKLKINRTKNLKGNFNDAGIKWYKDGKVFDSTRYAVEISAPSQSGSYIVTMTGSVCPDSTTKTAIAAKIFEKPEFEFTTNPLVIVYQEGIVVPMPVALIKPAKDPITYSKWDLDKWLKYPIDTVHARIVPEREQVELDYDLTVRTGPKYLDCSTIRSIHVINSLPLVIPNAFSPNGDGINDNWVITGLNKYKKISVTVFNRWGNLVYQDTNGYKVPWDGNVNGVSLSTGTYYAILELSGSPDNTDQNVTRSLTIVR